VQLDDLAGDVRTDFHLCLGLDLAIGSDSLHNIVDSHLLHRYLHCGFLAEPPLLLSYGGKYYEHQYCWYKDLEYFAVFHPGIYLLFHWSNESYMSIIINCCCKFHHSFFQVIVPDG